MAHFRPNRMRQHIREKPSLTNTQEEMKLEPLIPITKLSSSNVGWQLAHGNTSSKGLPAKLHPALDLKPELFRG